MKKFTEAERVRKKYSLINPGKSHIIISPSIGCGHSCIYCNGKRNSYQKNYTPKEVVAEINTSTAVTKDESSLLFYGYSDPFLKDNCEGLVKILKNLEDLGWENKIGLITKINPPGYVLDALSNLKRLKPVVLISHANMISGIESPSVENRLRLMDSLYGMGVPTVCYLSPLVSEWSPPSRIEELSFQIKDRVNAIAISGLTITPRITSELKQKNIVIPHVDQINIKYEDLEYFDYVESLLKLRTNLPVFKGGFRAMSFLQS